MSSFGGFGGFGQNNQQQQNNGFGGFGQATNTNTGFGSTGNTGFGSTNTASGGLFGGGSSGFGGSGGAFGTPQNNAFGGAKPVFGGTAATSGGSLFGSGTATAGSSTGFSGFGSNNTTTSSPFGASNTGGGMFGGNKPAFGTAGTTSTNPFGGGTSTSFGGSTNAFGSSANTTLGGAAGECHGTGSVPFQATIEKEPNTSANQQNSFQSISFQQPYQKFSPEELRLADYTQGRRYGNASNQAGAFGANTGFGGFGGTNQTTTGGFGGSTGTGSNIFGGGSTSSPFGTSQPATSGFGANTGTSGGIFGTKPATTGLFGAQPQQSQPASTSLFGTAGSTGFGTTPAAGGFGTNTTGNTSIFGGTNNNNQPKTGFSFGGTTSTGGGFGTTATSGGFGGTGGLFGTSAQQQNTSTPFGGATQQPVANNPFGGFGGTQPQQTGTSSIFGGNNTQKPATGLFGTPASTGTGLFGTATQSAATNNLFGTSNTQNTSNLFGGSKPAMTGTTGLFGTPNTTQTNTGGSSLFSSFGQVQNNQNTQQQSTPSLFGGINNQQQKPSLFSQPQQPATGGLFGNLTNQQQSGGLFSSQNGNQQQQQQPQITSFGGNSIFGGSQQGQQTPQSLTTSITDNAAFGTPSLFSNLASTQVNNPGPIATPLSSSVKQKKSTALPMYKLNPASASRFTTPQKRGFGFTYSSYGTPGSASSASSTPGTFSNSMLGGNFGRGLSKSMSTSSLRRSFNTDESILAPGAFSASPNARHYGSTGSVKKLVINRGIRGDLFSPPKDLAQSQPVNNPGSILKKHVSFDASTVGGSTNGSQNDYSSPLKQVSNSAAPSSEELGYMRPSRGSSNGAKTNGVAAPPEMEQVKGNELAIVLEEEPSAPAASKLQSTPILHEDPELGQYWMRPSKEEIIDMNRVQRQKIGGFTIGREGVGHVTFNVPVDLTNINLDEIFDNIVLLKTRSATVYPNPAKKPPMGKGLNVPSTISLQNSWPRGKDKRAPTHEKAGPRFNKHVERLRKVADTNFVSYDKETGIWTFTVEHFTTYGLEYDDETDGEGMSEFSQSTLSAPPDTPTPQIRTPKAQHMDESFASTSQMSQLTESDPEDTFEFRKKKILPGAFDNQEAFEEDGEMQDEYDTHDQQSFLDERSVGSQSENGVEEPIDQDDVFNDGEFVSIEDQEMAGSFPHAGNTSEQFNEDSQNNDDCMDEVPETPGAIMRARMRAMRTFELPLKRKFTTVGSDWTSTLKTTVTPQKQDRALLKSLIDVHGNDMQSSTENKEAIPVTRGRTVSDGRGFATSIDLMNSLFGQAKSPTNISKVPAKAGGFKWPYAKKSKTSDNDMFNMNDMDRAFHESMKPSWGPDGTLVYAVPANTKPFGRSSRRARERNGLLTVQRDSVVSESRDVRFAKFSNESSANVLGKQKSMTIVEFDEGVPFAKLAQHSIFSDFYEDRNARDPAAAHERLVWELAGILFDKIEIPNELQQVPNAIERLRKDKLSVFWQKLVDQASNQHAAMARSSEEKAIASLSGHRIPDACSHLINGKDFHLATIVALVEGEASMRKDIREQLNEWQKSRVLSEFSQPIRAIYEILAGNVCVCDGTKGAPMEDRIESFIISKRFGLDWRQAFGLRLWYAILATDNIQMAVHKFTEDLEQERETSRPEAWYVEQGIPTLWDDEELQHRDDLLWGLLKLYSYQDVDLEAILQPENSQLSPLDFRLSWQLSRALSSFGVISYGFGKEANDRSDSLTLSFASQLTNEGDWLDATYVLLHLSSAPTRAKSIQNHLAHHAGRIGSEDSPSFATLSQALKVPATWIWEAKALHMRSVKKDSRGEVECLIKAGSFEEAHRTFTKEVAPTTIIERDYDTLQTLLVGFESKENTISEWHLGGEIYQDFLALLDCQKKSNPVDSLVLERLLAGLPAVVADGRRAAFMETVAIEMMSGVVAKIVAEMRKNGQKVDLPKVLRLPLTEDKYLSHTVDMSLGYYRSVMAGGR